MSTWPHYFSHCAVSTPPPPPQSSSQSLPSLRPDRSHSRLLLAVTRSLQPTLNTVCFFHSSSETRLMWAYFESSGLPKGFQGTWKTTAISSTKYITSQLSCLLIRLISLVVCPMRKNYRPGEWLLVWKLHWPQTNTESFDTKISGKFASSIVCPLLFY